MGFTNKCDKKTNTLEFLAFNMINEVNEAHRAAWLHSSDLSGSLPLGTIKSVDMWTNLQTFLSLISVFLCIFIRRV